MLCTGSILSRELIDFAICEHDAFADHREQFIAPEFAPS